MNKLLIFVALTSFMQGYSSAWETSGATSIAPREAATYVKNGGEPATRFDSAIGVNCTTRYFPMSTANGKKLIRKSVDCEE